MVQAIPTRQQNMASLRAHVEQNTINLQQMSWMGQQPQTARTPAISLGGPQGAVDASSFGGYASQCSGGSGRQPVISSSVPQDAQGAKIPEMEKRLARAEKEKKRAVSSWPPPADEQGNAVYYVPDHLVNTGKASVIAAVHVLHTLKPGGRLEDARQELNGSNSTDIATNYF